MKGHIWFLAALGLMLTGPITHAAADSLPPVSDYFRPYAFEDARLSPAGNLALVLNRTDPEHQYVSLIDLQTQTSTDLIVTAGEAEHFSNLQWISDDTAVFTDNLGKINRRLISVH
jgi:hypothetical protein